MLDIREIVVSAKLPDRPWAPCSLRAGGDRRFS